MLEKITPLFFNKLGGGVRACDKQTPAADVATKTRRGLPARGVQRAARRASAGVGRRVRLFRTIVAADLRAAASRRQRDGRGEVFLR